MTRTRVLIAADGGEYMKVESSLSKNGFDPIHATNGIEAMEFIRKWTPEFTLMDLFLPGKNAMECLDEIKKDSLKTEVIVISGHSAEFNVKETMTKGAIDYLVKPFTAADLIARMAFHLRKKIKLKDPSKDDLANKYLHLLELVFRQTRQSKDLHDFLFKASHMLSLFLKANRVSFVRCTGLETAYVMASSDDPQFKNHTIDLNKYPEIVYVINSGIPAAIEEIEKDPTLVEIKKNFKNYQFSSIVVAPVYVDSKMWGVLSARMPETKAKISEEEIRITQIIAHIAGLKVLSFD